MKTCSLAMGLLLVASSAPAQPAYTEKQVIDYAKSIDLETLDPSLPSQRLEDWLQTGPPHAHILMWIVQDTCQLKPDPTRSEDYPLCAEVWVSRNGEAGILLVQVGTWDKGIIGPPQLYGAGAEEMEEPLLKTGSAERLSDLPGLLDQPAVTGGVEKLYKEIATHHPVGIPKVAEMATIRPYLSKRLTEQLRTAQACQADYFRQHHLTSDGIPKPRWLKTGLFSGDGNHALPDDPTPDRKEQHKDGTFLVYVMLSTRVMRHKNSHKGRFHTLGESWQVAVKAISEDGQFVVDDLRIFDSYDTGGPSHLLSDAFTGCDGPHWTGLTANK